LAVQAVQHVRRMRGGAQSHLMRCDDGHCYVVKFQNLCGAPHKFCNVENSVMWSWPLRCPVRIGILEMSLHITDRVHSCSSQARTD